MHEADFQTEVRLCLLLARLDIRMLEREPALVPAKFRSREPFGHPLRHVDPGVAHVHPHIIHLWLFQSQSKVGAASAHASNKNAHPDGFSLAQQPPGDLLRRLRRHGDHGGHLHMFLVQYPVRYHNTARCPSGQLGLNGIVARSDT